MVALNPESRSIDSNTICGLIRIYVSDTDWLKDSKKLIKYITYVVNLNEARYNSSVVNIFVLKDSASDRYIYRAPVTINPLSKNLQKFDFFLYFYSFC